MTIAPDLRLAKSRLNQPDYAMVAAAINRLSLYFQITKMFNGRRQASKVVRFGRSEVVAEGLRLNFWADISHRCMTASWPSFIGGAVAIFVVFNALFGLLYWLGNDPISNVTHSDYID